MLVDTNVVLRILAGDEGPRGRAARSRVRQAREHGTPLGVPAATLLEVAFVLQGPGTGFGWQRQVVAEALRTVLDEPAFAIEHADALRAALASYEERSIDLHDCYLDALARQRGTRVLSFDDDLRRLGTGEAP